MRGGLRRRWRAVAIAATVAPSGCDDPLNPGAEESLVAPRIEIVSPDDGDEIASSSVWLEVRVDGLAFAADAVGAEAQAGQGHYHVYVDGNARGEGADRRFLVTDLVPGAHEIAVRLFENDHRPVPGSMPSRVTVRIPSGSPRVEIVTPGSGSVVRSSSAELAVRWENYTSGRFQAYLDDLEAEPAMVTDETPLVVTDLHPGRRELFVRLHHQDGTPFEPAVIDRVEVVVPENAPRIAIVHPENGATIARREPLRVSVASFHVDGDAAGGGNEPGVGHFHVYVNGYDSAHQWQEGYRTEMNLANVPVGEIDVFVRLMNNDHTSLEPKVIDRVRVSVE